MTKALFAVRRWILCHVLDEHDNADAQRWDYAPLFPIVCDHCDARYYHTRGKLG